MSQSDIITYRGKPIDSLDREKLLEALAFAVKRITYLQKRLFDRQDSFPKRIKDATARMVKPQTG